MTSRTAGRLATLGIQALLRLPYAWRVPLSGWLFAQVAGPLAGYRRRVRENLARALPGLPAAEVRRLTRAVPDNIGRSLIEIYSGAEFAARAPHWQVGGPGLAPLEAAHRAGQPVILVNAHFGNFDAVRSALIGRGIRLGALYRPMEDERFNAHYVAALSGIGLPLFRRGREGMAEMVRFLRGGGVLMMLIDQHMGHGEPLTFFGHRALTATSAAKLALKHDALLVPAYGIRAANGLDFRVQVEPPVPHGDPAAMTQALNDNLEAVVRQNLAQWFWSHRRWKGG
jgi:KDO2-lipid IV(A) lauroyltransferase